MKTVLLLLGIFAVVSGLFFAAQGSGLIPWPERSFMVNTARWIYYGLGIAAVGLMLIVLARR
jgi:hypothetical protein